MTPHVFSSTQLNSGTEYSLRVLLSCLIATAWQLFRMGTRDDDTVIIAVGLVE